MKKCLLTIGLLAALAAPVAAQTTLVDVPILSEKRISMGLGANYSWWHGDDASVPSWKKEWQGGIYAAYVLTPNVAVVGKTEYGVDSKLFNTALGVRVTVFAGNR